MRIMSCNNCVITYEKFGEVTYFASQLWQEIVSNDSVKDNMIHGSIQITNLWRILPHQDCIITYTL